MGGGMKIPIPSEQTYIIYYTYSNEKLKTMLYLAVAVIQITTQGCICAKQIITPHTHTHTKYILYDMIYIDIS